MPRWPQDRHRLWNGYGVAVAVAVGSGLVSASGVGSLADDCAPFLGLKILGGILSGRTTAG